MGDRFPGQDGHERPRTRLIKRKSEVDGGLVCGLKMDNGVVDWMGVLLKVEGNMEQ